VDCAGEFEGGGVEGAEEIWLGLRGRRGGWDFVVGAAACRGDDAGLEEDFAVVVGGAGAGWVRGWEVGGEEVEGGGGAACWRGEAAAVGLHCGCVSCGI
jgi:hypothetical protein